MTLIKVDRLKRKFSTKRERMRQDRLLTKRRVQSRVLDKSFNDLCDVIRFILSINETGKTDSERLIEVSDRFPNVPLKHIVVLFDILKDSKRYKNI